MKSLKSYSLPSANEIPNIAKEEIRNDKPKINKSTKICWWT